MIFERLNFNFYMSKILHEDLVETDDVAIITIDLAACFGSKLFSVIMFWNECSEDTRSSIIFTPSTVSESRSPEVAGRGLRRTPDKGGPCSSGEPCYKSYCNNL